MHLFIIVCDSINDVDITRIRIRILNDHISSMSSRYNHSLKPNEVNVCLLGEDLIVQLETEW